MKYQFQYHGEGKEGHYFTIITDNESGVNMQGVDIRHLHFILTGPRELKAISYMEILTFKEEPTELATIDIMNLATRALHGLVPYNMPIYKRKASI